MAVNLTVPGALFILLYTKLHSEPKWTSSHFIENAKRLLLYILPFLWLIWNIPSHSEITSRGSGSSADTEAGCHIWLSFIIAVLAKFINFGENPGYCWLKDSYKGIASQFCTFDKKNIILNCFQKTSRVTQSLLTVFILDNYLSLSGSGK